MACTQDVHSAFFEMKEKDKKRRLKVLVSAYSFLPGYGSEPAVGWNFVNELAKLNDVWVVTNYEGKHLIDEYGEIPGIKVHYYDMLGAIGETWLGRKWMRAHYHLWQFAVIGTMRKLHKKVGFDICHHVTFVKYWAPTGIAWVNAPLLWGPVGGAEPMPREFLKRAPLRAKIFEYMRFLCRQASHMDPFVRMAAKRAAVAIAVNNETKEALKKLYPELRIELMTQIGQSKKELAAACPVEPASEQSLHKATCIFICVGNLIYWKGVHLALEAFSKMDRPDVELWVVGHGEEKNRLLKLAKNAGISEKVRFMGQLSHAEAKKCIKQATCLVHTSLHDSGGFVLAEAMANSRPVICLRLAGPDIIVPENAGIKIVAGTEEDTISGIAQAMIEVVKNPARAVEMGMNGRRHVENDLLWSEKIKRINGLYRDVIRENTLSRQQAEAGND